VADSRFIYDRTNCAYGADESTNVDMGVSVGWRDLYAADIELQWIDVSDVAPGEYYVAAGTDPDDVFDETDETNNGVAFSESTVIVPGYRPEPNQLPFKGVPISMTLAATPFADPSASTAAPIDKYFVTRGPAAFATLGTPRFEVARPPAHGTVALNAQTGAATYTRTDDFPGTDTFEYTVYDTGSDYPRAKPTATVSIVGPQTPAAEIFGDVEPTDVFHDDITWLFAQGITKGCTATTFCPDDPVTRAQLATFLVRSLHLAPSSVDAFGDDDGSIHEADIQALAATGITRGCAPTLYCPDQPVTRAQMASFLTRAAGLDPSTVDAFGDDDGSIHEADIQALAATGITRGCAPDLYCPDQSVTRAQMAAFLHRAFG
jgi:hypothetical protein